MIRTVLISLALLTLAHASDPPPMTWDDVAAFNPNHIQPTAPNARPPGRRGKTPRSSPETHSISPQTYPLHTPPRTPTPQANRPRSTSPQRLVPQNRPIEPNEVLDYSHVGDFSPASIEASSMGGDFRTQVCFNSMKDAERSGIRRVIFKNRVHIEDETIASILAQLPIVEEVVLEGCRPHGLTGIAKALKDAPVTTINLDNLHLGYGQTRPDQVIKDLLTKRPYLHTLNLSNCRLFYAERPGDSPIDALYWIGKALSNGRSPIRHLTLTGNTDLNREPDAANICRFVEPLLPTLTQVDLSRCDLNDHQIMQIGKALSKKTERWECIGLAGNHQLTYQGIDEFQAEYPTLKEVVIFPEHPKTRPQPSFWQKWFCDCCC